MRIFHSRDFRLLFMGQLVSGFGDWLATFAFISLIYSLTGSTTQVAFVLVLRLIPPMFAAPIGGIFADRFSRKAIMVASDIIRAVLISAVPFFGIGTIYIIAFLHESMSLFFIPSRDASIPQLVRVEDLEIANGSIMASSYGMLPLAGLGFSLLQALHDVYPTVLPLHTTIDHHPEYMAFMIDAVTFLFSALCILAMRFRGDKFRLAAHKKTSMKNEFLEGVGAVWKSTRLRSLAYGIVTVMFGAGVLFAIGIGYVHRTLKASNIVFGWMIALWGVGMIVGLGIVQILVRTRGRRYVFILSVISVGGIILTMSILPFLWIALPVAVPFGIAFSASIVLALTIAQSEIDDERRGRVMAGIQVLYRLSLAIGALSIGSVVNMLNGRVIDGVYVDGDRIGLFISGVLIVAGAALSMRRLGKGVF